MRTEIRSPAHHSTTTTTHTHTHSHTYVHLHTHTHTYIYAHMYACTHIHILIMCVPTYTHTHTHIVMYRHSSRHTSCVRSLCPFSQVSFRGFPLSASQVERLCTALRQGAAQLRVLDLRGAVVGLRCTAAVAARMDGCTPLFVCVSASSCACISLRVTSVWQSPFPAHCVAVTISSLLLCLCVCMCRYTCVCVCLSCV